MIAFPVALVRPDGSFSVFERETAFVGPDDVQHPAEAWGNWSAADWVAMCPGWAVLRLSDEPPVVAGKRTVRLPLDQWEVGADAVTVTYDLVERTPDELAAELARAEAQTIKARADAVQRHIDAAAVAHGYDSIATLVTYADEPAVEKFQLEGQAARAWRSAVWARCYALLDEVREGTREALTDAELIAELPALDWPSPPL